MRYDSLPFITVSASMDKETVFPILHSYAPYASEFLLQELSKMLTGDFKLDGEISVLPNLMASQHALDQLMYVQAFMIFNAGAGYYTEREGLDSYELRYTLSGEGVLEYEGKKYTLKEGDGYFISCQKPHIYYSGKNGWKSTVLHINGGLCSDFFERYEKDGQYRISNDTMPSFETMQFQVLQATQKVHPYQEYRINCLLDLLLTELLTSTESLSANQKGNNAEVISTLLDYIHSHYMEDIVFEKMAKTFGISRTLLFSEFKRYTGFTPAVYLMKIRISQAKLLLANTSLSVESVSMQAGFNDAGHFSQIFKKEVGTTPLKYRKSAGISKQPF